MNKTRQKNPFNKLISRKVSLSWHSGSSDWDFFLGGVQLQPLIAIGLTPENKLTVNILFSSSYELKKILALLQLVCV